MTRRIATVLPSFIRRSLSAPGVGRACSLVLLTVVAAATLPTSGPLEANETVRRNAEESIAEGHVVFVDRFRAGARIQCAIEAERIARVTLEGLKGDLLDDPDEIAAAVEFVERSVVELMDARNLSTGHQMRNAASPDATMLLPEAIAKIDEVLAADARVLDLLSPPVSRRRARRAIRELDSALTLKLFAQGLLAGSAEVSFRDRRAVLVETLFPMEGSTLLPVRFAYDGGMHYAFESRKLAELGLRSKEEQNVKTSSRVKRLSPEPPMAAKAAHKKEAKVPKNRYLSFRGKKKNADGLAFHALANPLIGPYEVQYRAGLFRKPGKKHSPSAFLTVEFDVQGSAPLDFFVVSTRYAPADNVTGTPAGIQVFTGSTGGAARGDLFVPGALQVDVRVVFDGTSFEVFVRPAGEGEGEGEGEEAFVSMATWMRGGDNPPWVFGVGAARMRKGTELGIDDLVVLPR